MNKEEHIQIMIDLSPATTVDRAQNIQNALDEAVEACGFVRYFQSVADNRFLVVKYRPSVLEEPCGKCEGHDG